MRYGHRAWGHKALMFPERRPMSGPRVSCAVGRSVGFRLVSGCGSDGSHSPGHVTVQLDVTTSGPPATWLGTVTVDGDKVDNETDADRPSPSVLARADEVIQ